MNRVEERDAQSSVPENELLEWGDAGHYLVEENNSKAWISFEESDLVEVKR